MECASSRHFCRLQPDEKIVAMKRGAELRWTSSDDESTPSKVRRAADHTRLCSPARLAAELFALTVLLAWAALTAHLFALHYDECRHASGATKSRAQSFVNVRTWISGHRWGIAADGELIPVRQRPPNASWHIEWQPDKTWFCLRSLRDLRLLEITPADRERAHSLRLNRVGCNSDEQLFRFHGRSIFSKGASSMVNLRELRHLRTHGDSQPWRPLAWETRTTRVVIEEALEWEASAAELESRLLAAFSGLESRGLLAEGKLLLDAPLAERIVSEAAQSAPSRELNSNASQRVPSLLAGDAIVN